MEIEMIPSEWKQAELRRKENQFWAGMATAFAMFVTAFVVAHLLNYFIYLQNVQ
jgi:hypothetical protein